MNTASNDSYPAPAQPTFNNFNENDEESYDENNGRISQSRQSGSMGIVSRQTRMMA